MHQTMGLIRHLTEKSALPLFKNRTLSLAFKELKPSEQSLKHTP